MNGGNILKYKILVKSVVDSCQKASLKLKNLKQVEINWIAEMLFDVNYSGLAIDEAIQWANDQQVAEEVEPEEGEGGCMEVTYFKNLDDLKVQFQLTIKTSSASDEQSNILGEGLGSLWTSKLVQKRSKIKHGYVLSQQRDGID